MTKKQLKKLAKQYAALEIIVQTSDSNSEIDGAKEKMFKLMQSVSDDLGLDEMLELDDMIQELIDEQLAVEK